MTVGKTAWQMLTEKKAQERVEFPVPLGILENSRIKLDLTGMLTHESVFDWCGVAFNSNYLVAKEAAVIKYDDRNVRDFVVMLNTVEGEEFYLLIEAWDEVPTLFKMVDQIYPNSANEWNVWLNRENGLMFCSELNAPNGFMYTHTWGPLQGRSRKSWSGGNNVPIQMAMFSRCLNNAGTAFEMLLITVSDGEVVQIMQGYRTPVISVV